MLKKTLAIILSVTCLSLSAASVLFQDDFNSDDGSWSPLVQSAYTIADGKLELHSTSSTGQKWVIKTAVEGTNFLYEATAVFIETDTNARAGLTFRTQDNMNAYHLYVYPSSSYIVYRYVNGTWTDFSNHYLVNNSFIRNDTNRLAVCTHDSVVDLYCNNNLLVSIRDTSLAAINTTGMFGLIISGKCRAAFTQASVIADSTRETSSRFSDDFSNSRLVGWRNYGGIGTFTVEEGYLRAVSPASNQIATLFSNGNYGTTDTIEVKAIPQAPLPAGGYNYGVTFHYAPSLSQGGNLTTNAYHFCVVNGSHYTLLKQSASGVSMLFDPTPSLSIQSSGTNTLKVINHADGKKELFINGNKVREFTDASFLAGGVGLMLNGGVNVLFDDFEVRGQSSIPSAVENAKNDTEQACLIKINPNPFNPVAKINVTGVKGKYSIIITDATGRHMTTLHGNKSGSAIWNANGRSAGIYIASLYSENGLLSVQKLMLLK